MKIFNDAAEMQSYCLAMKREGKSIGLVPTMGYLHQGHLSLVQAAKKENDLVVVSVFVNPIQFGAGEDYEDYPRDLSHDTDLLENEGVDLCFAPTAKSMYPAAYNTYVQVEGEITQKLCGKSRPGHFKGVTTVVSKLFHICQPDRAYFGQKDAQQVTIIEKMVKELNFPLRIVRVPIMREADGLALSSRNVYLDAQQRQEALVLNRSLQLAREKINQGERDVKNIKQYITDCITASPQAQIDYVEVVDGRDLSAIDEIKGKTLIALAVKFGSTRLIDNLLLEV